MGLDSSGNVGRVGGNDVVDIPGKPGKGGKDSGPVGDEGPGKLSKLAALFRPLDTTENNYNYKRCSLKCIAIFLLRLQKDNIQSHAFKKIRY